MTKHTLRTARVSEVRIPTSAATLEGFRAWATSDAFPERGRFCYLDGELYIDMSPEELDTHNKVKVEISRALSNLNRELDLGEFYGDGTLVTNEDAELSTEPDGTFVSWHSFEANRVRLTTRKRRPGQYIEMVGSPDWVLEVVSQSSVAKDTQVLRAGYHRAGVREYWLVDARSEEVDFQLLRRRSDRYVGVPVRNGWRRSPTFGRGVSLERTRNRAGRWEYTLRIAP